MDAKSKANFINSVSTGTSVPCPICGAINKGDNKFCTSCGAELIVTKDSLMNSNVSDQKVSVKSSKYIEPNTVFAEGLPD